MTTQEAIKILKRFNVWRRGADIKMTEPKTLGQAIDKVIRALESIESNKNVCNPEIKWVSIDDQMPESGKCVLINSKSGGVSEGSWIGALGHFEQWRWNSILADVTHWAELPKPPCV